jgi:hypothetical protein
VAVSSDLNSNFHIAQFYSQCRMLYRIYALLVYCIPTSNPLTAFCISEWVIPYIHFKYVCIVGIP